MSGQGIYIVVVFVEVLGLGGWFVVVQVVKLYGEGCECILFIVLVGEWDIVDVKGIVGVVVYGAEVVVREVGDGVQVEGWQFYFMLFYVIIWVGGIGIVDNVYIVSFKIFVNVDFIIWIVLGGMESGWVKINKIVVFCY